MCRARRTDPAARHRTRDSSPTIRSGSLARTIAALSTQVSRTREAERLWRGVRFRIPCALVEVRLLSGGFSLPQLDALTGLISSLAAQMQTAMEQLEEASVARLRSSLTASTLGSRPTPP